MAAPNQEDMTLDGVRLRIKALEDSLDTNTVREIISTHPKLMDDVSSAKEAVDDLMRDCKSHNEYLTACTEFLLEGQGGNSAEEHEVLFEKYLNINERYINTDSSYSEWCINVDDLQAAGGNNGFEDNNNLGVSNAGNNINNSVPPHNSNLDNQNIGRSPEKPSNNSLARSANANTQSKDVPSIPAPTNQNANISQSEKPKTDKSEKTKKKKGAKKSAQNTAFPAMDSAFPDNAFAGADFGFPEEPKNTNTGANAQPQDDFFSSGFPAATAPAVTNSNDFFASANQSLGAGSLGDQNPNQSGSTNVLASSSSGNAQNQSIGSNVPNASIGSNANINQSAAGGNNKEPASTPPDDFFGLQWPGMGGNLNDSKKSENNQNILASNGSKSGLPNSNESNNAKNTPTPNVNATIPPSHANTNQLPNSAGAFPGVVVGNVVNNNNTNLQSSSKPQTTNNQQQNLFGDLSIPAPPPPRNLQDSNSHNNQQNLQSVSNNQPTPSQSDVDPAASSNAGQNQPEATPPTTNQVPLVKPASATLQMHNLSQAQQRYIEAYPQQFADIVLFLIIA